MKKVLVSMTVSTSLENVAEIRGALVNALSLSKAGKVHSTKVSTCFSEIAVNTIEHGEAQNNTVELFEDNGFLYLTIQDDGSAIPSGMLGQGVAEVFSLEEESGRGLNIIRTMAEHISYTTCATSGINRFELGWPIEEQNTRKCVLLVDDDVALTCLYQNFLEDEFSVLTANSAQSALAILGREAVDIVISDINMPEMNGLEFREKLNANMASSSLPFIFLTMDESRELNHDAILTGVDDYLQKPVDKSQLVSTVTRVLYRFQKLRGQLNTRLNKEISAALEPVLPKQVLDWRLGIKASNTGAGGGDLVIFHPAQDGATIVIVDVMGHDDVAKFFSYAYAGFIRGVLLARDDISPSGLLAELSQQMYTDTLLSRYALTCLVIKIDRSNTIQLASAGHPAPFVIGAEGTKPVDCHGMMLGLLADQNYESTTLTLKNGERLAAFTDGLFEGAAEPEQRKQLERDMLDRLASAQRDTIDAQLTSCFDCLKKNTHDSLCDDALLILLEHNY